MWLDPQETVNLVTFTEEILIGKLHFLCRVYTDLNAYKLPNNKMSTCKWIPESLMYKQITFFFFFFCKWITISLQMLLNKKIIFSTFLQAIGTQWTQKLKSTSKAGVPKCSSKQVFLKYFTIFTGKHLCWSLFLIKLQAWRPLLKRDSNTNLSKSLRVAIFIEHLRWLLLHIIH